MRAMVKALGNEALLSTLSAIGGKERAVVCEWLVHLGEVEARHLHVELGFASLWEFCTKRLGLCETTAWRRIAAARVCRAYPEALAFVASGELQMSVLSLLQKHLTPQNATELFESCRRKSFRLSEVAIAARFPNPDVKDSVRRLPGPRKLTSDVASGALALTPVAQTQLGEFPKNTEKTAEQVQGRSLFEVGSAQTAVSGSSGGEDEGEVYVAQQAATDERAVAETPRAPVRSPLGSSRRTHQRLKPLSAGRYAVRFTASEEFRTLLQRVRALASHRLPSGDLETLLHRGLEAYERELLKDRFAVGKKARAPKRAASSSTQDPSASSTPHARPPITTKSNPRTEAQSVRKSRVATPTAAAAECASIPIAPPTTAFTGSAIAIPPAPAPATPTASPPATPPATASAPASAPAPATATATCAAIAALGATALAPATATTRATSSGNANLTATAAAPADPSIPAKWRATAAPMPGAGAESMSGGRLDALTMMGNPNRGSISNAGAKAQVEGVHASVGRNRGRVAAGVTREVYRRDEGRCTFVADDGRRCGARHFLELDHVEPHARLGPDTVENLRLRCAAHNLWHARGSFGAEYVRTAIARAQREQGLDASPATAHFRRRK